MKEKAEKLSEELRISLKETSDYKYALDESCIVAITDHKGIITYANQNFCKISKYSIEELIGKDHRIINSGYHPKEFIKNIWKTIANGNIWKGELKNKAKDGTIYWVDTTIVPFLNQEGKPYQYVAIRSDITEKKKIEDKLASQYARSLIEASLDPLVTISPEGKITDVNEASVKVTGIPREQLIGTDFSNYFTEPEKAREGYKRVFEKGFVSDYPLTILHKDGSVTDVLYNASVYKDDKGTVLGVFAAARDITAQRKQEIKINTLNEELEQRIIELESFSYSVSHDLRAPLRGIDGFIAIFLNKYLEQVDEEGQRLLTKVRKNVSKMSSLIDELLTLSRIGMKDIQFVTINMKDLTTLALDELGEMKGKAKVVLHDLQEVQGDIALIKQVLVNLLSNAFKYSNKNEAPVIEIGCTQAGKELHFYVKDNGVGFDMDYSNKLFGVFQRLHDPHEYQGTGVGLAIVKRIITRHGGKVWAEGKEGEGATFYFSLRT